MLKPKYLTTEKMVVTTFHFTLFYAQYQIDYARKQKIAFYSASN